MKGQLFFILDSHLFSIISQFFSYKVEQNILSVELPVIYSFLNSGLGILDLKKSVLNDGNAVIETEFLILFCPQTGVWEREKSEHSSKYVMCDAGIVSQSILLGATEKGLGDCMFGSVQKVYQTLLSIALQVFQLLTLLFSYFLNRRRYHHKRILKEHYNHHPFFDQKHNERFYLYYAQL